MGKPFSRMSLQELRDYNRQAQQRHREAKPRKAKRRDQLLAERKRLITNRDLTDQVLPAFRPTPEMLADAMRRNSAPRPATAWLMGDPPPGESALDKRKQNQTSSGLIPSLIISRSSFAT